MKDPTKCDQFKGSDLEQTCNDSVAGKVDAVGVGCASATFHGVD